MKRFLNTLDTFGDVIVLEAETPEKAADQIMDNIEIWAMEECRDLGFDNYDEYADAIDRIKNRIRTEFINGLKEV